MFTDSDTTEKSIGKVSQINKPIELSSSTSFTKHEHEIIQALKEQIRDLKNTQQNLRRVNNTLMNALQINTFRSDIQGSFQRKFYEQQKRFEEELQQKISQVQKNWRQKYQKQCKLTEELSIKLQILQKELQRKNSQSVRNDYTERQRSQRKQSIKNMNTLMDSILKDKLRSSNNNWNTSNHNYQLQKHKTSEKQNVPYSYRGSQQKKPIIKNFDSSQNTTKPFKIESNQINSLITALVNQKIDYDTKIKNIELELSTRNPKGKQKQLLQVTLKNLKKKAKDDHYKQFLKQKISNEIQNYTNQIVSKQKRMKLF